MFRTAILAATLAVAFSVPFQASAQSPAASPACLYAGKAYSEGAYLCVRSSVMLTCAAGSGSLVWKLADGLSAACGAPGRPRPARAAARAPMPQPAEGGKCFTFAGKRYCE